MISALNDSSIVNVSDQDFVISHYRDLLHLALKNYSFSSYEDIPWGQRFILWRHDVDFSLNRALVLARIEKELGVSSTYFINPHSEFYNCIETDQFKIVREILSLGHRLGLHFDSSFYSDHAGGSLDRKVFAEAKMLEEWFDVKPDAFSFHNPTTEDLKCDADYYGGLVNCYSFRFRDEVGYCSDSNGYWRFRRLYDVLSEGADSCLQVLTHPGWWQDKPMPARQRVFRCLYGRAASTMHNYDEFILSHGRTNFVGNGTKVAVFAQDQTKVYALCDFLWNEGHFSTLFLELWRQLEAQIRRICCVLLNEKVGVPAVELYSFYKNEGKDVNGFLLLEALLGKTWGFDAGLNLSTLLEWANVRDEVVYSRRAFGADYLEQGCVDVCMAINTLRKWGLNQTIEYGGLVRLSVVDDVILNDFELNSAKTHMEIRLNSNPQNFNDARWETFKANLKKIQAESLKTFV